MRFLYLIWSNLKRKKLRTSLTILSVFVAFVLFGLLCAIKEAFTAGVSLADTDRLIVRNKVSLIQPLPASYQEKIEGLSGVAGAAHWNWFNGLIKDKPNDFFGTFPVDPDKFFEISKEFTLPPDQLQAWKNTRTGAVIGKQLANRFDPKWKIGDHIQLTSPIYHRKNDVPWEFDIVGIYDVTKKNGDTSSLFFRYDYFDEAREEHTGEVGWYLVRVKDPAQTTAVAKAIDAQFENSPYETKSEAEGAFAQSFAQQMGDLGLMLIAILSAVFFTILLVAGNTMAQSVRERTEEIGVLKAMGFTNRLVLVLVLLESCLIATVGGLAGLALVLLITAGGSPAPALLPIFYLPTHSLIIGLILVAALGIVTGILPSMRARRLQIASALGRQA